MQKKQKGTLLLQLFIQIQIRIGKSAFAAFDDQPTRRFLEKQLKMFPFLIGAVVGLILFLIIKIVHLIWIGAVVGGLIGFVIGFRGSSVNYLEDSTQITVGMGGKIIVFAIVFAKPFPIISL